MRLDVLSVKNPLRFLKRAKMRVQKPIVIAPATRRTVAQLRYIDYSAKILNVTIMLVQHFDSSNSVHAAHMCVAVVPPQGFRMVFYTTHSTVYNILLKLC